MKINRRTFLKSSGLLTGLALTSKQSLLKALTLENGSFRVMKGNIGIFTERGGTIGWFVNDDSVVAIDSQFPETVKNFIDHLKSKTSRKIDYLFNTHHHGDHTSGNKFLSSYANEIVANENCVRLQKIRINSEDSLPASKTFSDEMEIDLGKEKIKAYHFGKAHTGGDAVYHFVNHNVVHFGDLVFNGLYPFVNLDDEADFDGWIKYLDTCYNKFDGETTFIFGHSTDPNKLTGDRENLIVMRDYLSSLLDFVKKNKSEGKTKEEISSASEIPNTPKRIEAWEGALKINIEQAYDYLNR